MADEKAAPTGGTPASPSPGQPSSPDGGGAGPLSDWESRYNELNQKYAEEHAQVERYKPYGDPDQVGQALQWARERAQEIQQGRLTYAQEKPAPALAQDDPFDGWDDLSPREQATRLREVAMNDFRKGLEPELKGLKEQFEGWTKNQQAQFNTAMYAMQLAAQHPDIPYTELLQEATKLSTLSPQELLNQVLQSRINPKKQEQALKQAREEAKAEAIAELQKKQMEQFQVRPSPRLAGAEAKDPLARRQETNSRILQKIHEFTQKAG